MRRPLLLLGLAFVVAACATSPLGRQQLRLFPDSEIDQMGVAAYAQAKQETPPARDTRVTGYVACVAKAVTAQVRNGPREWEVTVFDKDEANAFALPGGKIGIYTGILKYAKDQDELASVVAHEVGHVLAKHANERVSTAFATETGLQLIQTIVGGSGAEQQNMLALLGLGAQVGVILPFSRTQETESDLLGLDLMARAGFDPRASVRLWKNMSAAGGGGPELLSTHPANASRIDALERRMPEAMALYRTARERGRVPACAS